MSKNLNKLNLTLPPIKPLSEIPLNNHDLEDIQADISIEVLQRTLVGLELNYQQRNRLERFWGQKQLVGTIHSLNQLTDLGELGTGSGGIVFKCKHIKSDQIMARKVLF